MLTHPAARVSPRLGITHAPEDADPASGWGVRIHIPQAEAVYVMGRFNNWSTCATPMQRLSDGFWFVRLSHDPAQEVFSFYVWGVGGAYGRIVRHRS